VLLVLNDQRPDKQVFRVSIGFPGKRSVSDRDAVIEELKAQGSGRKKSPILPKNQKALLL